MSIEPIGCNTINNGEGNPFIPFDVKTIIERKLYPTRSLCKGKTAFYLVKSKSFIRLKV